MSEFILSCCSTADKTVSFMKRKKIVYACFHYHIGEEEFVDDLGQSVSFEEFYEKMRKGAAPETSQVNAEEFMELWTPYLEEGKDILHVTLSSGISGVYNSACIAMNEMREKYPDRKIYVVDSLGASTGYGMLLEYMADMRDAGKSIDEVYQWAEDNKLNIQTWFFVTDLKNLVRGGRVSATSAFIGNALNICPLLNINYEGKLIPRAKIRTKKKVMKAIVEKMEELAEDGRDYKGKCAICCSDCPEDALKVRNLIESTFPKLQGKVTIDSIGTVIGSHTGPGTVGVFFMGQKREEE